MRVGAGRRVCLVGAFALDNVRDRFADQVRGYSQSGGGRLPRRSRRQATTPPPQMSLPKRQ